MAIRTRKDERAMIIALLEGEEYESADKLADAVLKTSYELLQQREWWVFGAQLDDLVLPYGFFSSSADALKAATAAGGPVAGFVKILPAGKLAAALADLDKPLRVSCECGHFLDIHADGSMNPGCPVRNCECTRRH